MSFNKKFVKKRKMCDDLSNVFWYCVMDLTIFSGGSAAKNPLAVQETPICSLVQEEALEKKMTTHSSIFAWEIPWSEGSDGLQSNP